MTSQYGSGTDYARVVLDIRMPSRTSVGDAEVEIDIDVLSEVEAREMLEKQKNDFKMHDSGTQLKMRKRSRDMILIMAINECMK